MSRSRNNALEFSSAGSIIVSGSNSYDGGAGKFGAVQCLKDTEIDELNATNIVTDDGETPDTGDLADTFNAGTIIYGDFTDITLVSGLVALHRI
tara:strand:- start:791 stop:1072 length:282 start_codon:yes stop_codon:yes gene_type:complete